MVEEIDNIAVEEGNDERVLACEIMDGRKCNNTKNQYRLKMEHFKQWVVTKYPTCMNGDSSINLASIDKSIVREFYGHICKSICKNVRTRMGPWFVLFL